MDEYFKVTGKKSVWFNAALTITFLMQASILSAQFYFLFWYDEMDISNHEWYIILTAILILIGITGTFLTYLFKKIGVYLVIATYFIIISIQPTFSLVGSLSVIFALFFFIVFGLLSIIPRWKMFD